tara:strand:- start:409 stop:582 length:174 start_codon:yes stop_codon:yes gene_type:complete
MEPARITIRNIDPEVLQEARQIVRDNPQETMGSFVSTALYEFIESLPFENEVSKSPE